MSKRLKTNKFKKIPIIFSLIKISAYRYRIKLWNLKQPIKTVALVLSRPRKPFTSIFVVKFSAWCKVPWRIVNEIMVIYLSLSEFKYELAWCLEGVIVMQDNHWRSEHNCLFDLRTSLLRSTASRCGTTCRGVDKETALCRHSVTLSYINIIHILNYLRCLCN